MLAEAEVTRIRDMLAAGDSQRAVSRNRKHARKTIAKIVQNRWHARRPDPPPPPPPVVPSRCGQCGRMVTAPCLACAVAAEGEELSSEDTATMLRLAALVEPLGLDLRENQERYLEVRRRRDERSTHESRKPKAERGATALPLSAFRFSPFPKEPTVPNSTPSAVNSVVALFLTNLLASAAKQFQGVLADPVKREATIIAAERWFVSTIEPIDLPGPDRVIDPAIRQAIRPVVGSLWDIAAAKVKELLANG